CYPEQGMRDTAKSLAIALGLNYAYGSAGGETPAACADREVGQAILTRFPILRARRIELPRIREPRAALLAELRVDSETFRVVSVHLENRRIIPGPRGDGYSRLAQIEHLLAELEREEGVRSTVLAGDFNTYCRGRAERFEPLLGRLAALGWSDLFEGESPPTIRQLRFVRASLDTAFARGLALRDGDVDRSARGSDHWPVHWIATMAEPLNRERMRNPA
ncbi:MAG: endonuclease/exonuclease/phosphatase family protein, partial [Vicinamibacteria bacterium]